MLTEQINDENNKTVQQMPLGNHRWCWANTNYHICKFWHSWHLWNW